MKNKITISISKDILNQIDKKIDKKNFRNRSSIIENLIRKGLNLRTDIGAVIIANENNWEDGNYPLNIPKILIKIDGKTLLEKHFEYLQKANIKKVILAIGKDKNNIINFCKTLSIIKHFEIEFLEFLENDLSLKIISLAKNILNTNKILTILGDNYFYPLDLTDFISYHNENKSELSIIVKNINDSLDYGNIEIQGNNIVNFIEKPKQKQNLSNLINTGIYLLNSSIIPDNSKNLKIETDFFPNYVKNKKAKAYFHNGKWFHIQSNKILNIFK